MTADFVAESAETLAEELWAVFGYPSEALWEELPEDQRDDWREDAAALIASGAIRPAAEVRAEALREAADTFEWAGDDDDYRAFRDWLRDRAALAEALAGEWAKGGPYHCCPCCADPSWAHEDGQRDNHDRPCEIHRAALDGTRP